MAKLYYIKRVNNMNTITVVETTISSVAKTFLNIDSMTPKKLQKLCYYAYSWYLTFYENERLFDDEFEAWIHGPVNPGLYREYRKYGFNEIPKEETIPEDISGRPHIVEFIEHIYQTYGHLDGDQLEWLTHQEAPWVEARGNLKPYEPSNEELKDDVILSYFRGALNNG